MTVLSFSATCGRGFILGCVLLSSQPSDAVELRAASPRAAVPSPPSAAGLCLCVLLHFLSVPFKIIPLFLPLFQLVLLSGGQDLDDKLHQRFLPIPLVLFFG